MNEYSRIWNWTIPQREIAAAQLEDMCGGSLFQTKGGKYIHNTPMQHDIHT